jgi:hypothetical protein
VWGDGDGARLSCNFMEIGEGMDWAKMKRLYYDVMIIHVAGLALAFRI